MTFNVTRSAGVIVQPCESTPSDRLKLSIMDRMLQMKSRAMLVYQHGGNVAAEIIRKALSKVLVPYFPLAGRVIESDDGELQVACTGEGSWFIKASADCTLASIDYFNNVHLMPNPPPSEIFSIEPLVQMQVTSFTCGGFVIGFTLPHSLLDGLGTAQFFKAMGELARGHLQPTVAPVWLREAVPTPRHMMATSDAESNPPPPPLMFPTLQLEQATIDISLDKVNKLKKEFLEFSGDYCSTFDVAVADLWRHWTLALDLERHIDVSLLFSLNAREFLTPPLPKGFYGNCVFTMTITTSTGWLMDASDAEVVKLVKDTKAKAPKEFTKWVQSEEGSGNPFAPNIASNTLAVANWGSLGFDKVDYGWGSPLQLIPFQQGPVVVPYAALGLPPTPIQGIRWITWCLNSKNLPSFINGYRKESLSRL